MARRQVQINQVILRQEFPLTWLWEHLEDDPGCEIRRMFGGRALYLDGRLCLYFCASEEPWNGVCACTDRLRHAALVADCPALVPHPLLAKWLYLSEHTPEFERDARWLVGLAAARDPRLGVDPVPDQPARPAVARPRKPRRNR